MLLRLSTAYNVSLIVLTVKTLTFSNVSSFVFLCFTADFLLVYIHIHSLHEHTKRTRTSMPEVGFEPTILRIKRILTSHASTLLGHTDQHLEHGCAKVAHCVPLGDVTSPTTVTHNVSMTCSEHREALTAAPTSD